MARKRKRAYSPDLVNKFVTRVPIKNNEYSSMGLGEYGYYTAAKMKHPKHIVILHKISPEITNIFEARDNIKVHDFSVDRNSYSRHYLKQYAQAAQVLHDAVKKGEPSVVSCELCMGRTGNVMYFLHRMMGASHAEATHEAYNRGKNAKILEAEFDAGFPSLSKKNKKPRK